MVKHKLLTQVVTHQALGYSRTIAGTAEAILAIKAKRQNEYWQTLFKRRQNTELSRQSVSQRQINARQAKEVARVLSKAAEKEFESLSAVWQNKNRRKIEISWKALLGEKPNMPQLSTLLPKPDEHDFQYQPALNMLDKLSVNRRDNKRQETRHHYEKDLANWAKATRKINLENQRLKEDYRVGLSLWMDAKKAITKSIELYRAGKRAAIIDYCDLLLFQSPLPNIVAKIWQLEYSEDNQCLSIDYCLPTFAELPKLEVYEPGPNNHQMVVTQLAQSTRETIYDNFLYQLALRIIDEQFTADKYQRINQIVFKGYINDSQSSDSGNRKFIMSLAIERENLDYLHHTDADVASCFLNLGGSGQFLHRQIEIVPEQATEGSID